MSVYAGPQITTNGLVFHIDAYNSRSNLSTSVKDLSNKDYTITANSVTFTANSFQVRNDNTNPSTNKSWLSASFNEGVLKATNIYGTWSLEGMWKNISAPVSDESFLVGRIGCHGGIYLANNGVNTDVRHAIKTGNCWTGALFPTVATISPGTIIHSIMTYNNGVVKSYINGQLVLTSAFNYTSNNGMNPYGDTLCIGGWSGDKNYATNSDIYAIRCYTTELSGDEVLNNFNASRGRYGL
jgi:hypothetical protein